MGRGKLKMELITDKKACHLTFQKRKNGLKKKAYELATLCDVGVGMIIYGPKQNEHSSEPEIWPSNSSEIHSMIESYKKQYRAKRTHDLSNFSEEQMKKVEDNLMELPKKNDNEAAYPTWESRYNTLSEVQLRELSVKLDSKLEAAKARLDSMKANQDVEVNRAVILDGNQIQSSQQQSYLMEDMARRNNIQLKAIHEQSISSLSPYDCNLPLPYYQIDQTQEGLMGTSSNSMMMMMMMDDSYCNQLGGASSSNAMDGPMDGPNYLDLLGSGMLDNMMVNSSPMPTHVQYYHQSMQMMPRYVQYPMMPSSSSQVYAPSQLDQYYKVSDFQMMPQYVQYPMLPNSSSQVYAPS